MSNQSIDFRLRSSLVSRKFLATLVIALGFGAASVFSQTNNGALTGTVTDSASKSLQGARVEVQPSGRSVSTSAQGSFTIADLPPGDYTITVSYLGFSPFLATASVVSGQTAKVSAVLSVSSLKEEINVTAERPSGEAEAINRERSAENILQVLPAEVITSLPNANVADAIGRLPSVTLERDEGEGKYVQIRGTQPRFSNVTIDGVNVPSPEGGVRQVKLDVIPSDLVESVEINKTLLANMDGDAIGGSVNLVTKTAGEKPTISLFGQGGYTPILNGRGEQQYGGTLGYRFGKEKNLGVLFGGTYDWNGRGIDDVEPAPSTTLLSGGTTYFPTFKTADLREYRYYRGRLGFDGSIDYKISDNSNVYLRALYSHFDNFGDRWVYTPTIGNITTSPLQGDSTGNMSANSSIRRPVQVIGSLLGGGRHALNSTTNVLWDVAISRAATEDKGYSQANFGPVDPASPLNNVQFGVDLSNPYRPRFPVQNGVNIYDASQYYLSQIDYNHTYSPQLNVQLAASLSKSYSLNGHFGTFQFGGKFRNEHKFEDSNDTFYNPNDPTALPMSNFGGSFSNSNYYDKSYSLGPLPNYNKINSFFDSNPGAFSIDANTSHQRNDPNNWDIVERVSAGYLMNSLEFGRFQLYTGLRLEATNLDVLGYHVNIDASGNYVSTLPARSSSSYINPMPSAQLRYRISPSSGLRLAYGRGISRPDFGDLPPFVVLSDKNQSISVGNPNLTATRANNYDLLYEQYLNPLGVIQAGFFYKDIRSPIYYVQSIVNSGTYTGYQQTQPLNGSSAYVYGFEIAYQQHLSYLPGLLSGSGISANYSWTTSQANGVPGRSDHPALLRQAPNTWNVSPTYDHGRLSMRVGISYNDSNIFAYNYQDGAPLGLRGPNGDNYLYAHLQLDAQGSYRLAKGFSAMVYGLNLNNEVFGFYQGSGIFPIQREYYKPTIAAGLRWNLSNEK